MDRVERLRKLQEESRQMRQRFLLEDGTPNPEYHTPRVCPVCNNEDSLTPWLTTDSGNRYVKCNCGMRFVTPTMTANMQEGLYTTRETTGYKWDAWKHTVESLKPATAPKHSQRYELLLKHSHRGKLLDFGCGFGNLADELKFFFDEVEGLEIDPERAQVARDTFGITVYDQKIDDLDLKDRFDAVICYNALEHFLEPLAALTKLHEAMRPQGVVYIEVPAWGSLSMKILGGMHHVVRSIEHINMFNAWSLGRLFEKAGFQVLEWRTVKLDLSANDFFNYEFKRNEFVHRLNPLLKDGKSYRFLCRACDSVAARLFPVLLKVWRGAGSYLQMVASA
ncbi:MAG: class I SAM-dependent methyltransferase [Planctomycetes bacterium]|nr:class I SAM-dependent methyltransferase [Planctomycetota bacterium]